MRENGQEQEKGVDSFFFKWFFFLLQSKKQLKAFICYAVIYANKHWVSKMSLMISYCCQTFCLCMTIMTYDYSVL